MTEGTVPFEGGETWYRIVGDARGAGEAAARLPCTAAQARPTTTSSRSKRSPRPAAGSSSTTRSAAASSWVEKPADFWTVDLFVREVQAVRDALGLDRIHLFGSSWGAMLSMEYALTQPTGVASLVLSSGPASIPLWAEETTRLKNELPDEIREVLDTTEVGSPEYEEAAGGVLRAARLPCRPEPRLRPADVHRAGRASRRLHDHAGPERVRDHGDAEGLGHHRAPARDPRFRR